MFAPLVTPLSSFLDPLGPRLKLHAFKPVGSDSWTAREFSQFIELFLNITF
jgi:hypothetical protein